MFGTRRALVAVLATAAAVLALGQSSSTGVAVRPGAPKAPLAAADFPPSAGHTVATSVRSDTGTPAGGNQPIISGDGRTQAFVSRASLDPQLPSQGTVKKVFVRDLQTNETTQVSVADPSLGSDPFPDGDSFEPSISDDGSLVSFITEADNILPNTGGDVPFDTLVVCDVTKTPLDCISVYSAPSNSIDALLTNGRPRLSGNGARIVWARSIQQDGATEVQWAALQRDAEGKLVPNPTDNPVPADNCVPVDTIIFQEQDPVLDQGGGNVFFAAALETGSAAVFRVNLGSQDCMRFDVDPDGGFLGDEADANHFITFDSISVADFGSVVAFRLQVNTFTIGARKRPAAKPHALPTSPPDNGVYVVRDTFPTPTSELVSKDNAGTTEVETLGDALSGNGRYVAFAIGPNVTNTYDAPENPGQQIVVRDLTIDSQRAAQGLPRIKGALVTARDPSVPLPSANCTNQTGASCLGVVADLSMDDIGSQVSFSDTASDLVAGDSNGRATDSFVRTWTPTVTSGTVDFGQVQIGTTETLNAAVTVSGFGPLTFPTNPATTGGQDPQDFKPGQNTCQFATAQFGEELHDGQSCSVAVQFTPDLTLTTDTQRSADLLIKADQFATPLGSGTLTGLASTTGPTVAAGDTTRSSLADAGTQAATGSSQSMVSGNGRWDVFVNSSDLAGHTPVDQTTTNQDNIFVRDLADPERTFQISLHTNVTPQTPANVPTHPVSVPQHPTGASPNGASFSPSISDDGRFVSFITDATDIVPPKFVGDQPSSQLNLWTVLVCDRDPNNKKDAAGNPILDQVTSKGLPKYACFAVESGSNQFGEVSNPRSADEFSTPQLAGNGTRVTWVEDLQSNDAERAVIANLAKPGRPLHVPTKPAYVPIFNITNFTTSNPPASTDALQFNPRLTRDGNTVVFSAETQCCPEVFRVAVIETDLRAKTSLRLDTTDNGQTFLGDGSFDLSDPPATSADGKTVAFTALPSGSSVPLVYVATISGTQVTTVVESRNNFGQPAAGYTPALSGDGRYLAFQTDDANMHNGVDTPDGSSCNQRGDFASPGPSAGLFCQIVARDLVKDRALNPPTTWTPSQIVSSSLSDDCGAPKLPAGRVCAGDGNSINPSLDATGSEIGFDSDATDLTSNPLDTNDVQDSFVHTWRPTLSATPALNFGSVQVAAHKDKTFTLTESGFGPLTLGGSTLGGGNAANFSKRTDACAGRTLNDTDTCQLKLRFTPSATGSRTTTFTVPVGANSYPRHNPDNSISYDPILIDPVTGNGTKTTPTPIGQLTVNPTTLNFGRRLPLAPPVAKTVTLTDTGTGSVAITDVTVSDTTHPGASGDYTVNAGACPAVLLPGASCTVSVSFVGHVVGNRGAQLVITSDAPGGPNTVVLEATVPTPKVTANPGVTPPGRVTMISGTGFAPNRPVDVQLKGFGEQATATTDKHGSFTIGLVIFRNTPQGPQTVLAHTHGKSKTISASTPLLLAVGSVDILQLVTRH